MNDADIVADASAVIALLVGEPFTRFDPLRLAGASISAVNLSEVLARLRSVTRGAGLSLGDRACLALGDRLGCPVITADRAWASLDIGIEIVLIR